MERPEPDDGQRIVYATSGAVVDLIAGLQSSDPEERAKSAQTVGLLNVYPALPSLIDAFEHEALLPVWETMREALDHILPMHDDAIARARAAKTPAGRDTMRALQHEQARAVIELFKRHVESRQTGSWEVKESDLRQPVIEYLTAWGGLGDGELDEVGSAAAQAVGAITRFVEIPPTAASPKYMSYCQTQARVAEYESLLASRGTSPAYRFEQLQLAQLVEWLEADEAFSDVAVEAQPDFHVRARFNQDGRHIVFQARLERYEGPDSDFAGTIAFTLTTDVIYGPPLTLKFLEKFRAQDLEVNVRWGMANRDEKPNAMSTYTFELRHDMAPTDTVTREFVTSLARGFGDETLRGIVGTEMAWIFSSQDPY